MESSQTAATRTAQRRFWSPEEDSKLRQVVARYKGGKCVDWREVARELDGRTNRECRKRYCYSLSKGIKKGTWSRSEDEALLKGYQLWGAWWSKVAQEHVVNRTGDQCAKRFKDVLDPTINKREWSQEEDQLLLRLAVEQDRAWRKISDAFDNRPTIQCRNRYTRLMALRRKEAASAEGQDTSGQGESEEEDVEMDPQPAATTSSTTSQQGARPPLGRENTDTSARGSSAAASAAMDASDLPLAPASSPLFAAPNIGFDVRGSLDRCADFSRPTNISGPSLSSPMSQASLAVGQAWSFDSHNGFGLGLSLPLAGVSASEQNGAALDAESDLGHAAFGAQAEYPLLPSSFDPSAFERATHRNSTTSTSHTTPSLASDHSTPSSSLSGLQTDPATSLNLSWNDLDALLSAGNAAEHAATDPSRAFSDLAADDAVLGGLADASFAKMDADGMQAMNRGAECDSTHQQQHHNALGQPLVPPCEALDRDARHGSADADSSSTLLLAVRELTAELRQLKRNSVHLEEEQQRRASISSALSSNSGAWSPEDRFGSRSAGWSSSLASSPDSPRHPLHLGSHRRDSTSQHIRQLPHLTAPNRAQTFDSLNPAIVCTQADAPSSSTAPNETPHGTTFPLPSAPRPTASRPTPTGTLSPATSPVNKFGSQLGFGGNVDGNLLHMLADVLKTLAESQREPPTS